MVPTLRLRVRREFLTLFINLFRPLEVCTQTLLEIVRVDEVFAGVVRWIDVDHLDLAVVMLLQNLQHFQIVAFNKDVLGGVPVFGILHVRL